MELNITSKEEPDTDLEEIVSLASRLMFEYGPNGHNATYPERWKSVLILADLAERYSLVQEMVVEKAAEYADTMKIDDADPYHPNPFDILSEVRVNNIGVICFLETTIRENYGIPRWDAIRALCTIRDEPAKVVLRGIVNGQYPSRYSPIDLDIGVIKREYPLFLEKEML